jgi:hypothetical protein
MGSTGGSKPDSDFGVHTLPTAQPHRRRPPQRPAPSRQPRPKNITLLVTDDHPLFEVTHIPQQPPGQAGDPP